MIINSLTLENFKSHKNTKLNFNENISLILGSNGAGKSSILEAISLFYKLVKNSNIPNECLNSYRPKGIDFTGDIVITGKLVFEEEDIFKLKNFWKTELNKRKEIEIPKDFSYTFKFEYKLHQYVRTNRECGFIASQKGAKKSLYESDKESWQKLIDYIKQNLIPEILFSTTKHNIVCPVFCEAPLLSGIQVCPVLHRMETPTSILKPDCFPTLYRAGKQSFL